ncbi:MAG TPA: HEAT repeat domain-containing protein [Terriglobales bacterium]|nr:HEAT repeat domain-containing protein [Terriglobales bacterium]
MEIPPESWRQNSLDRQLVESILLDQIDVTTGDELQALLRCYRDSGLLDIRIYQARSSHGWKRQAALAAIGRTREPEAIGALSEALSSPQPREVTSAVRGLGRIGLPQAAIPILDRLAEGQLKVPEIPLKSALVNCCREQPSLLLNYLRNCEDSVREVLTRSLAEVISPELGDELALLCQDPCPEVRASVARALGKIRPEFGVPMLTTMTMDEVWFVRLRAVVSLAAFKDPSSIDVLVRCTSDPNRVVRQRAAMALVQFQNEQRFILQQIIDLNDKYALHSFVSELQRCGHYGKLIHLLKANQWKSGYEDLIKAVDYAHQELSMKAVQARPSIKEATVS